MSGSKARSSKRRQQRQTDKLRRQVIEASRQTIPAPPPADPGTLWWDARSRRWMAHDPRVVAYMTELAEAARAEADGAPDDLPPAPQT